MTVIFLFSNLPKAFRSQSCLCAPCLRFHMAHAPQASYRFRFASRFFLRNPFDQVFLGYRDASDDSPRFPPYLGATHGTSRSVFFLMVYCRLVLDKSYGLFVDERPFHGPLIFPAFGLSGTTLCVFYALVFYLHCCFVLFWWRLSHSKFFDPCPFSSGPDVRWNVALVRWTISAALRISPPSLIEDHFDVADHGDDVFFFWVLPSPLVAYAGRVRFVFLDFSFLFRSCARRRPP